ncbi:MAG TPA: thiolase domain-containing protein [Candidatus Bathyarchaeia archaeon]|nr:thiolase domain-containing protein [Candidatus Bathyarchaeia archaeon]
MKVGIAGIYQTKFGELWDRSLGDLMEEAARGAIMDAGIKNKQIESVLVANMLSDQLAGQSHLGSLLAQRMGIQAPVTRVEAACASGGVAIAKAAMMIKAGLYKAVLVVGAEKMTDLNASLVASSLMAAAGEDEMETGLNFVGLYALMAQAYFKKFGATEKDLALVAVKNHYHASLNGKAHFPYQISVQQVLASPKIADPLKLLDCSPISDGAAAAVLVSLKMIKKLAKKPIFIVGSGQASDSLSLKERENLLSLKATRLAAKQAFQTAGLDKKEIDLVEVHDCFTIAEILALEDLGFYQEGTGFVAQQNGEVKLGGKRPVNLSGGLKACGHPVGATGVKQIVEIVQQLRGQAGKKQVRGARVGLAHNVGGTGGTATVHILKKGE